MKFVVSLLAPIALSLPGAALANDEEPLVFTPTSQWNVDYAEYECALQRAFSDGEHNLLMRASQSVVDEKLNMTILAEGLEPHKAKQGESSFQFLPASFPSEQSEFHTLKADDGYWGIMGEALIYEKSGSSNNSEKFLQDGEETAGAQPAPISTKERASREEAITSLSVKDAFENDLLLQTGPLHSAMNVMRDCIANLHQSWGVEEAASARWPSAVMPYRDWRSMMLA